MARKKSKRYARKRAFSEFSSGKRDRHDTDPVLVKRILAQIYQAERERSVNDLVKALELPRSAKSEVAAALDQLLRQGLIRRTGKHSFLPGGSRQLIEASLEKHPRGFGFAADRRCRRGRLPELARDPFIAASRMNGARHGDRILITLLKDHRNDRPEAEIVAILQRPATTLAGIFEPRGRWGTVHPDDPRHQGPITISSRPPAELEAGWAVLITLDQVSLQEYQPLTGRITEVLGDPKRVEVQVRLIAAKYDLPASFSQRALSQARKPEPTPGPVGRLDLREVMHVTIDGKDAKDFDDAIGIVKTRNGYRLYVSIADVGAYVKTGSALDLEAYNRGTSVYFPGFVLPMLPDNLSNNLCSLVPGEERLTVTAIMDFDRSGKPGRREFKRSIIKSAQRFTYETVKQIIVDKDPEIRRRHQSFLTPLKWCAELADGLIARRNQRGALAFTIPEPEIKLDRKGRVLSIARSERNVAHQIIESFMLAANEAVAAYLTERHQESLYRIHEEPDAEKLSDFIKFSETIGITPPQEDQKPSWYNQLIRAVQDTPHEYLVNNLLLRTMQQARYSPLNVGHFGLQAKTYTHFTSPIRRYPDLIVHRILCRLLDHQAVTDEPGSTEHASVSPAPSLKEAGLHLSERERIAVSGERDLADRLKASFMAERLGEQFKAVISGVSENFLFVELLEILVSGVVPLARMTDDYYLLDQKRHRLVGDVSRRTYQVGNLVEVIVAEVDLTQHRIEFELVGPVVEND